MKTDHEQRTSLLSGEQVESVSQEIRLLIDQSATTLNQYGGITAQTVNIHMNAPSLEPKTVAATSPTSFPAVESKDGQARFRPPDTPIGVHWNTMPFADGPHYEVFLSEGSAMWLRVIPHLVPERDWSPADLLGCATRHGTVRLQPFSWNSLDYLRAEDGFGTYASVTPGDSETHSVAFAFETGEVWAIDTYLLNNSDKNQMSFREIANVFTKRLYDYRKFLDGLGILGPLDWVAGLEGVKGRKLLVPPENLTSPSPAGVCLSEAITARGTYLYEQLSTSALLPFFNRIFRKCGMQLPNYLIDLMQKSR
ncbi:MAG: hypothetical protein WA485_18610 [Candidatus Sulfotelmatobacter sp.]